MNLRAVSILLDHLFKVVEAFSTLVDERRVLEPLLDDPVHHGVGKCYVGRRIEPDILVGKPCRCTEPRVDHNNRNATLLGLHDAPTGKRVSFYGVGTPHHDQVRVQDILERVGCGTRAERQREPCD
ncbi:MAG: hypothetical protein A4E42_01272 [Methanoregulaceae archaeon PtaU1.Bin222]|nr:MAG: hypothetical protein A4E42_01272 [Methanoregulaceae archaeon PtaU1.Bin222]